MVKCPYCGTPNHGENKSCSNCGALMTKYNKPRLAPHTTLIFIVILAMAVVIGVSIAVIHRQKSSEPENYYVPVNKETVQEEKGVQYVNNQLVVISQSGVSKKQMEKLFSSYKLSIVGYIELMDTYQVRAENSLMLDELETIARQLEENPLVQSAHVDVVWENETNEYRDDPWSTDGSPSSWDNGVLGNNWGVKAINAPYCWDHYDLGPIYVGIMDSMFDSNHEDIWFNFLINNDIFETYVNKSTIFHEDHSKEHGTHVSGIIGARHNSKGISGVVEDCYLYGYSIVGSVGMMNELGAIASLAQSGAKVINYSYGHDVYWDYNDAEIIESFVEYYQYYKPATSMATSIKRLLENGTDFLLVVSGGNNSHDAKWNSIYTYIFDRTVKDHIIVVGAAKNVDSIYLMANFSNYGDRVDVMAPGCDIYSCLPYNEYGLMSGTSQAAPHVTGVCACVWAADPTLTGAEVKRIVVETADIPVQGDCPNMVNMQAAMARVLAPQPDIVDVPIAVQADPEQTQQAVQFMPELAEQSPSPPPAASALADGTYDVRFYKDQYKSTPQGTYATVGLMEYTAYSDEFVDSLAVGNTIAGFLIESLDGPHFVDGDDEWIIIDINNDMFLFKHKDDIEWGLVYGSFVPVSNIVKKIEVFFPLDAIYIDGLTAVSIGEEYREIQLERIEDFFLENYYYNEITVTITVENGMITEAFIPYMPC